MYSQSLVIFSFVFYHLQFILFFVQKYSSDWTEVLNFSYTSQSQTYDIYLSNLLFTSTVIMLIVMHVCQNIMPVVPCEQTVDLKNDA